jgi:hypothetical protein
MSEVGNDPPITIQVPVEYAVDKKAEDLAAAYPEMWGAIGDARQDVLVCADYKNSGAQLLGQHSLISLLTEGEFDKAAIEFKDSQLYREAGPRGDKFVEVMRTGEWPEPPAASA